MRSLSLVISLLVSSLFFLALTPVNGHKVKFTFQNIGTGGEAQVKGLWLRLRGQSSQVRLMALARRNFVLVNLADLEAIEHIELESNIKLMVQAPRAPIKTLPGNKLIEISLKYNAVVKDCKVISDNLAAAALAAAAAATTKQHQVNNSIISS